MKTLIEQFVTQVLSSTENFTLTDEIHNITCTQFKRGQAIFVYGNVSGSYELNLNISAEKVTLRLYAIVREGQIYFYDLNCFGIYAGEDKQKLPKDCMTLKEYQELWKERQRQLIKEYQEEFLEGKLLREKIQDIQLSEKSSNKCKCDARRHLLHKTFPDDLAISTDISISKQDCVDHLCGFINLKEKIKQKLIDENNDLSLRLAKNLVVKDYMKYKVYGNYVFSKFLGEVEASSQEEAIEKALDDAPENAWLCVQCAGEFEDAGELDENSIVAEEIR